MSKISLPKPKPIAQPQGLSFELAPLALERWNAGVVAKDDGEETDSTISIYDPIGFDPWTGGGVTAKRIAAALRSIGKKNVVVNINSPGGDLFEGFTIYNMLRDHDGQVIVRVVGLAASAASVIAMAGDKIQIARAGFMMIHNCMAVAVGNRNDLLEAATLMEEFDGVMAGIYEARTGIDQSKVAKLMDKETWFSGDTAIENGFADELLTADQVTEKEGDGADAKLKEFDVFLARSGMPRAKRRALYQAIKESGGKPSAAAPQDRDTPSADPTATLDAGEVEAKSKQLSDSFLESIKP